MTALAAWNAAVHALRTKAPTRTYLEHAGDWMNLTGLQGPVQTGGGR